MVKKARNALKKIYKPGFFYQKVGIILSNLKDSETSEFNLFSPAIEKKSKKLKDTKTHRL